MVEIMETENCKLTDCSAKWCKCFIKIAMMIYLFISYPVKNNYLCEILLIYVDLNLLDQAICKLSEIFRQFVKCLFRLVNAKH